MTTSIFIKSYSKDFELLGYCLRSIKKFATGFDEVVLAIPEGETFAADDCRIVQICGETEENGYNFQQCVKMHAHQLTTADQILFLDSDCFVTKPITPQSFVINGKLYWLMTPYAKLETPWQESTEKFLGEPVGYEFMRRHPTIVPRSLLVAACLYCEAKHGMKLADYIMQQDRFSEFNCLGALAFSRTHADFTWINTDP